VRPVINIRKRDGWQFVIVSVILIKKDKVTDSTVPVNFQGRENLELTQDNHDTQEYAMAHTGKAQRRSRYNLRAKEKSFEIGQKVLVLTPDSTSSKTFSRWVGPAVIKDKLSNHIYLVDINGAVKHIHADKPRKYQQPELLPSQRIDLNRLLCHISVSRTEDQILALLDRYSEYFYEKPGFVTVNQHELDVSADCKPPRLRSIIRKAFGRGSHTRVTQVELCASSED